MKEIFKRIYAVVVTICLLSDISESVYAAESQREYVKKEISGEDIESSDIEESIADIVVDSGEEYTEAFENNAYDEIVYLTDEQIRGLPQEGLEQYERFCREIEAWRNCSAGVENIRVSADIDGISLEADLPLELPADYVPPEKAEDDIVTDEDDVLEEEEFDTLLADQNYYVLQLSSSEEKVYKTTLKTLKKRKRKFSLKGNYASSVLSSGITAAYMAKPEMFDFVQNGSKLAPVKYRQKYRYRRGYITYVKFKASKHYSKKLEKQVRTKVNSISGNARAYATVNYPNDPVYGMVEYFHDWINSNAEEKEGSYGDTKKEQSTKTYFYSNTAYGPLLKGMMSWRGYARAMSRLLDAAGIRNMYVQATARSGSGGYGSCVLAQMVDQNWYIVNPEDCLVGSDTLGSGYNWSKTKWLSNGGTLTVPTLSESDYVPVNMEKYISLPESVMILRGDKAPVGLDSYFNNIEKQWSSSDPYIATVSSDGMINANNPGMTVITLSAAGVTRTCTVYVVEISSLTFDENSGRKLDITYKNKDGIYTADDAITLMLSVSHNLTGSGYSAENMESNGIDKITAKSSNSNVVGIVSAEIHGDSAEVTVLPQKKGKASITISFGGKKAVCSINSK